MTELETYKRALQKISEYGIKPKGETELQRIKRLKSIADKALFIADVSGRSEQFYCVSSDALVYGKPCEKWCYDENCKALCKQ